MLEEVLVVDIFTTRLARHDGHDRHVALGQYPRMSEEDAVVAS